MTSLRGAGCCGSPRQLLDPRRRRLAVRRAPRAVEQKERSVGNANVVERIEEGSRGVPADARRRATRATSRVALAQRRVELAVEATRDRGEQANAEQRENREERADIPRGESKAQAPERLWTPAVPLRPAFIRPSGTQPRASV